ncbi:MAG: adenylate/guanylate cyclase domain-containing protein, partial [Gammaproteobacteria bacterium]
MKDRLPRKLAGILYADVAGYSRLTGEDEEGTHHRLSEYLDLISDAIGEHQGRVVHYAGDAVLADFDTVTEALSCSACIQRALVSRNRDLPDERKVEFRIGVNLGEVIVDRDDIYGDGVNVAARLESLAEPSGICISESVRTAVGKKLDLGYEFMGEQKVKNIEEPVRAYRVLMEKEEESKIISTEKSALDFPDKPSIAVLPFDNMSGDSEQEYFADGISEDLITALSKIHWFFVIARNSSFTYKGQAVEVTRVASELGVRYVIEGSVRKAGSRVRISAQLIDATTGRHVWAERYDRSLVD